MDVEGKGFVIKDRRSFDEKGDLKEQEPQEETTGRDEKKAGPREPPKEETQRPPLPEANFNSLIFSLSSSALLNLGEIADPHTGETREDPELAKHTIDTIAMLKQKTEGNLTEEEKKFVESMLTDLRWRYVKAREKK